LENYISYIETELSLPVGIIAFGPERDQIHFRKTYF
jgi:adenylosuccinate synthase